MHVDKTPDMAYTLAKLRMDDLHKMAAQLQLQKAATHSRRPWATRRLAQLAAPWTSRPSGGSRRRPQSAGAL